MTDICDPRKLKYPKYPSKAVGTYSSRVVVWPYPREVLQGLLPDRLELAPQTITAPDAHPVVMLFGQQTEVKPDFFPFAGMNYFEFIFAIPFVQWKDPDAYKFRGPFAYMPRLYLDKVMATLLGYMYGYPKLLARIQGGETYRVRDLLLDRPLIRGEFRSQGDARPVSAFPNFEALRPIFEIPFVGKLDATPYICSRLTFHLDDALMRSCTSTVELQYEFLDGVFPDTRASRGIEDEPMGSFDIHVPWELTLPFGCDCLECKDH